MRVGHCTVVDDARRIRTGVTVVEPCPDPWNERPVAACDILNGHGKSVGLMQIEEVGELETPIALTNTLAVWTVAQCIAQRCLPAQESVWSINPVVGECNDGSMSDIRSFPVREEHVEEAFGNLSRDVEEGSVGAGAGMTGWGYKAGIGTASRVALVDGSPLTVGVLALTNTGDKRDLRVDGFPVGRGNFAGAGRGTASEGGSIILICATDAPVEARQLRRIAKRCALGLARVGGTAGHGSGDITIAFAPRRQERILDRQLSPVFSAAVEATEAAILHSLFAAETTVLPDGRTVEAIPKREVVQRVLAARAALLVDRQ